MYCLDALNSLQNSFPCTVSVTSHSNFERNTLLILFYRCGNKSRVYVTFPGSHSFNWSEIWAQVVWEYYKSFRNDCYTLKTPRQLLVKKEKGETVQIYIWVSVYKFFVLLFLCLTLFLSFFFFFFLLSLLRVIFPHKLLRPARISN